MQTPLSARLTYRIMAVVLAMMAVIAGVVYYTVRSYMRDEAKERYLSLLLKNHEEVRRRLLKVSVALENNLHDIERDLDSPDKMFAHMEHIVRQNPAIACCNLLFEPGFYPDKGRMFIPCARRAADSTIVVTRVDSTYHSYFSDVWVPQRMKQDQSGWTSPYYESRQYANGQEPRLLTSYTLPIHNRDGRPVAMLAADLSLEELRDYIMNDVDEINQQYEKGQPHQSYFFIIDRNGTCVVHPDRARMLKTIDPTVGMTMKTHRGTCLTEVDGVMSRLYYRSIPTTDWVLVIVTPMDVIMHNALRLNTIILMTMLLGLAAIYIICRRLIRNIADPVAMQKATLDHELKIANAIQMAMLPKPQTADQPPLTAHLSLHASLTPAREVGGDLYDYFVRDDRLFFCIGDVSGKGVPAALVMALVKAVFRSESRRTESAAAITDAMNRDLTEENSAGYFATMFVGILDLATGHLDYCNAGHEPPLLLTRNAQQAEFSVIKNLPVGALSDWTYQGQQAQLQPGSMLFLYTDGLSEAQDAEGRQVGRARVRELAASHANDTPRQLIALMEDEVRRHANGAPQNDDITLLAIKWQPAAMLRATYDAEPSAYSAMRAFFDQAAACAELPEREVQRLRLAAEEAVANIVNHAQATSITLQADVEAERLVLTIEDDGQPFDPTAESPTDLSIPPDKRPAGGLGVMLIQQMADDLAYERSENRNILKIIKNRTYKS